MTTVGSLSGDLASSTDVPGGKSNLDNSSREYQNLPPSPSNSVPFIIATSADEDKAEKPTVAPVNGGSPMRFLACSKLDMEPNPFEQSFAGTGSQKSGANHGGAGAESSSSSTVETPKPILPPIEAMSGRLAPGTDQFGWDAQSLRMGPLSPSMLEGPQNPIVFDEKNNNNQSPLSLGAFSSSASMSTIFTSGAPLGADNGLPYGVPGPLPPVAVHPSEPFPPFSSQQHQQQQPSTSHQQGGPPGGSGSRPSQSYTNTNNHPPMNDRYIPPQGAPQHPDNMNGYGNLHLLSQAQATHREIWTKRESTDVNGGGPHNQHPHQHSHPHPHPHGPSMGSQPPRPHPPPPPPMSGQSLPGMPGMVAAPQLPKNGIEPTFGRGVRRSRNTSEDNNSDDSDISKQSSSNGGEGSSTGNSKKKSTTGDEKADEEEKRRNFLERNRQAALKCRQRKKQWLANLQAKVEYLTTDNEHLQNQTAALRDEIIHLKALLLAHKDCPVAQANGVYPDTISMSNHGGMMGHDRSGYPMQQHPPPPPGGPQQGRGGPPNQPRGPLPPPPLPPHHHGPIPGGRMTGQPVSSAGPPGSMPPNAGNGRPMSMMQDITPSASPSQGQANVRY
ncbi:hypothetical protein BGZ65_006294 [Modicella reniformis]|uniref:BZIP domain-containing protein n=1 Tax=Modicella reniformis TaxID=1440133 RepID=A0A9P6MLL9_9FUNG|nr:hypothetical protein BGZ65_006294 [Modicella reniformis]